MKIDDFYLNVSIDFERELKVEQKRKTWYSFYLSRSDLDSWYYLLKKKYDKKNNRIRIELWKS